MRSIRLWLAAAWLLALVACGGGGGGGGGGSPAPGADETPLTVSGTLSGLGPGKTVVLQLATGGQVQETTVSADGSFSFPQPVTGFYEVTVRVPPAGQVCTVINGQGEAGAAAPALSVACAVDGFRLGGSVTGNLDVVVLRNTANGETLTLGGNGTFTFTQPVLAGGSYAVVVAAQSASQSCSVAGGSGTATANVTGVQVTCQAGGAPPPVEPLPPIPATPSSLTLTYGIKTFNLSWSPSATATSYRLFEDPDGLGPQAPLQIGGTLTGTSYSHVVSGLLHTRLNAQYSVQACNAGGCSFTPNAVVPDVAQAVGYFKASNTGGFDEFGISAALSADGTTLAIGAWGEDSNATGVNGNQADSSAASAGAVYVYVRTGGIWSQQAYVKASNTGQGHRFGYSLALTADGSTLAVGAYRESGSGAVYVFTRTAGQWSQQAYVKASNAAVDDFFGISVALSADGSTLAVGAVWEDSGATGVNGDQADDSKQDSGAVYVFTSTGGGWTQQAYVKASNTDSYDFFGFSLALSADGSTLAVGAWGEDSSTMGINGDGAGNTSVDSGAAYVFTRSAGVWSQQAYLKASNTGVEDQFGFGVALSGDGSMLVVGAPGEDSGASGSGGNQNDDSTVQAGAAYVFTRSSGTWGQAAYLKSSNPGGDDAFGFSVALSADGSTLAVGASGEDSSAVAIGGSQAGGAQESGAVYVFGRSAGAWAQQAYVKASNTGGGDGFGSHVALSADGSTLAVGASKEDSGATGIVGNQADNSQSNAGAVYLY